MMDTGTSSGSRSSASFAVFFSAVSRSPSMLPDTSSTNTTSCAAGFRNVTSSRYPCNPVPPTVTTPVPLAHDDASICAWYDRSFALSSSDFVSGFHDATSRVHSPTGSADAPVNCCLTPCGVWNSTTGTFASSLSAKFVSPFVVTRCASTALIGTALVGMYHRSTIHSDWSRYSDTVGVASRPTPVTLMLRCTHGDLEYNGLVIRRPCHASAFSTLVSSSW